MKLVVDCSYIMSSVFPNERRSIMHLNEYDLHAPSIFYLECNNVLINNLKRKRTDELQYKEYLGVIKELPITIDKFSNYSESIGFINKIAIESNLTLYDACYLELAIRIGAIIATLDQRLREACATNSIKVI